MSTPNFPIPVKILQNWLPHRSPMLWVDEVLSVDAGQGKCRVQLREDGLYMSGGRVRRSSFIEWMAQSYGFVRIAQSLYQFRADQKPLSQAYLVAIKDARIKLDFAVDKLSPGSSVFVQIFNLREIGPVTLIDSKIVDESDHELASASLRVYGS